MSARIRARLLVATLVALLAIPTLPGGVVLAAEATTTAVASSANPSTYGANVTFTATVTPSDATGTITFKDGASTFDTCILATGSCAVATDALTGGMHSITAEYGGDSTYDPSPSDPLSQDVSKAAQDPLILALVSPAAYGSVQTLTTSGGSGTGTVTYSDGSSTACSVAGDELTITAGTGSCAVTATKAADTNYLVRTSPAATVVVMGAATTTSVASDLNPTTYGTPPTFTATVSPATATGTVTLKDGATTLGTCTLAAGSCEYVADNGLGAGTHSITAAYAGDPDHAASTSGALSQVVNAKHLTISGVTASTKVYNGNTTATLVTGGAALVGVESGDIVTLNSGGATGTFADKHVGNNKTVTTSGFTLGGADAGNYALTQPAASADITTRAITVTAAANTKAYDGTTTAAALPTITVGSLAPGDSAAWSEAYDSASAGTSKTLHPSGSVNDGNSGDNYAVTLANNTSGVITEKGLTISGVTASNKVYDRTTAATLNTGAAVLVGLESGDTVTLNATSATGTFADRLAGNGKTVTITGFTLGGGDASNYTLTQPTAAADITKRPLTITATGLDKVYDGTTIATVTLSDDHLAGDVVTNSHAATSFADEHVGTSKAIAVTGIGISGADAANYSLVSTTAAATADITPRPITVTAVTSTKVYDGTTDAAGVPTITLGSLATGDTATWSQSFEDKDVGSGKRLTPAGAVNDGNLGNDYAVTFVTNTTGSITARPISVTADAKTKVYGNADPPLTSTITSGSLVSGDVLTGSLTRVAGDNIGTRAIQQGTLAAGPNYNLAYVGANLTITKRPITVAAVADTKVYDGSTASSEVPTITVGSLAPGDTATWTQTFNTKAVGATKTLTPAGAVSDGNGGANYTVTLLPSATGVITARPLAVTATGVSKVYDGNATATVTLADNRVVGDTLTTAYTSASFGDPSVGTGKSVSVSGISISGPDAANYVANSTITTTANIATRSLTVTATGVNKVYDGTAAATVTVTDNRVSGDVLTVSPGTATFSDRNVGTAKAVSVTGISISGPDAANYAANTTESTTANIARRTLTVTATGTDKVYDGTTAATVTLGDDRVTGDVLTVAHGAATFGDNNVGTGKPVMVPGIAISGTDAANYTANTAASTTADITLRPLTVTATGVNRVYDGTTAATVTLASDKLAGDTLTLAYTGATFGDKDVANGKTVNVTGIAIGGADAANYSLVNTIASATANITPKALAVTAAGTSRVYDGTTAATVTLADNRVAGDVLTTGYGSATFADKNVGTAKTVTVTGLTVAGADAANYTANASTTTTAIITARPLTVTADAQTKIYGSGEPPYSYAITGGTSLAPGDSLTGALTRTTGGVNENVGAHPILVGTLNAGPNYALTYVGANLTITKLGLTVTANAKTRAYGVANPALDATISGFAFGQNLASSGVTGAAACTTTALPASPVSGNPYPITCTVGTLAAANYDFTAFVGANLTVAKATTTTALASDDATAVFGQPVTFTATIGGLGAGAVTGTVTFSIDGVAQPTVAVTDGQARLTTAALTVEGSPYTITAAYSGDTNLNASAGALAGGQAVARAATSVTLTSDNAPSVYGENVTFTATISPVAPGAGVPSGTVQFRIDGFDAGVPVSLSSGVATFSTSLLAAGSHLVVQAIYGGDASFLGDVGTLAGGQEVAKATLTVTADPASREFGAPNPPLTASYIGFVPGDTFGSSVTGSPVLATTATPASTVVDGPYPITVDLGSLAAANYDFTFVPGWLTVLPATTTLEVVSSINPAVPGDHITLTATLAGFPTAAGSIVFQAWDGSAFVPFESVTLTPTFQATTGSIALPGTEGNLEYRAVFTSPDTNYANATGPLVQVIGKSPVTVTITASRAKWESTVPVAFTATITPDATNATVAVDGTVDFAIDGGTVVTVPVVGGRAILPARLLPLAASREVTAVYSGNGAYLGDAATPLSQPVTANLVEASGVAVSGTSIYPYKDTWRDTVSIRGTRTERLSVTIRVYKPTGSLLMTRTIAAGTGAYSYTWNGKTSRGAILAAGRYKVVQTLTDPSSAPALAKSWSSYVTLSSKRMTWHTVSVYRNANAPSAWSGAPSLLSSTRYSTGVRLITPTSEAGGWAAFAYQFTLPSASTIKSVAFYVQGGPWSGGTPSTAPKVGLHDWRTGSSWLVMYDAGRARRAVGTSTSYWYGIAGDPSVVVKSSSGKRYVRAYVDTGSWVSGFRYELGKVRVVVRYGLLK